MNVVLLLRHVIAGRGCRFACGGRRASAGCSFAGPRRGASTHVHSRYFLVSGANVVNVTNPMTSGSLLLRNVQPGARRVLKVVVVPLAGTAAGASQGLYVDVWSDVEKEARDSVFLKVDVQ